MATTEDARATYIRSIVDAAPPLTAEAADRLRPMLGLRGGAAPKRRRAAVKNAA